MLMARAQGKEHLNGGLRDQKQRGWNSRQREHHVLKQDDKVQDHSVAKVGVNGVILVV